jgi:hypothetical protein
MAALAVYNAATLKTGATMGPVEKKGDRLILRSIANAFQQAINSIKATTRESVFSLRDLLDIPVDSKRLDILIASDCTASLDEINESLPKWANTIKTVDRVISGVDFFSLLYYFANPLGLRADCKEIAYEVKELRQVPITLFSVIKNFVDFAADAVDIVRLLEFFGAYDLAKVTEDIGNSSTFGKQVAEFGLEGIGKALGVISNGAAIARSGFTLVNYHDTTVYVLNQADDKGQHAVYKKVGNDYVLCDGLGNPTMRKDKAGEWVSVKTKTVSLVGVKTENEVAGEPIVVTKRKLKNEQGEQVKQQINGQEVDVEAIYNSDNELLAQSNNANEWAMWSLRSVTTMVAPETRYDNQSGYVRDVATGIARVIPQAGQEVSQNYLEARTIAPLSKIEKAHHGLNIAYKVLGIILILAGTAIAADSTTAFVIISLTASGIGGVVVFTDYFKEKDRAPSQMARYEWAR